LLAAGFGAIHGLATGPDGSIYALDSGCNCVRKSTGAPPASLPAISTAGIVNAATLTAGAVAPGELISIFGTNFGTSALESFSLNNNWVPAVLDDIEVLINGSPVPITAVSSSQINAFIPYNCNGPAPCLNPAGAVTLTLVVSSHGSPIVVTIGNSATTRNVTVAIH
jgi:hypothetical protein